MATVETSAGHQTRQRAVHHVSCSGGEVTCELSCEWASSSPFRGVDFDGSTVGLANTNSMCTSNSGAVNEVNVVFLWEITSTFVYSGSNYFAHRTTTQTPSAWRPRSRTRWVTTWVYPTTRKTASVARRQRKKAASCLRVLGEFGGVGTCCS